MDNIYVKKIWEDGELIEVSVKAKSEFATINQTCYISSEDVIKNANIIKKYIQNNEQAYVEFGNKNGNYSPAFSMELFPCDNHGNVIVEVDMEIADNKTRMHRCKFFINTELGMLERFGEKLRSINEMEIDKCIVLYDE